MILGFPDRLLDGEIAVAAKAKKTTQRKLTAILSADVVGYSRFVSTDEEVSLSKIEYFLWPC